MGCGVSEQRTILECPISPSQGITAATTPDGLRVQTYTVTLCQAPDGSVQQERTLGKYRLNVEAAYLPGFVQQMRELGRRLQAHQEAE